MPLLEGAMRVESAQARAARCVTRLGLETLEDVPMPTRASVVDRVGLAADVLDRAPLEELGHPRNGAPHSIDTLQLASL